MTGDKVGQMGVWTDEKRIGDEQTIMTTHCPDCRSFSLTTAQLVSDSSSVGHRAACMVCGETGNTERWLQGTISIPADNLSFCWRLFLAEHEWIPLGLKTHFYCNKPEFKLLGCVLAGKKYIGVTHSAVCVCTEGEVVGCVQLEIDSPADGLQKPSQKNTSIVFESLIVFLHHLISQFDMEFGSEDCSQWSAPVTYQPSLCFFALLS